jgi:cysteine desulfurase
LQARQDGGGNHLIVSDIEHSAVMQTAVQLRDYFGFDLTILPVDQFGQINVEGLKTAVSANTALISIMAANNEIGSLQPIETIGAIAHEHGALFHSDAVQAIATRRWDIQTMPIDLISVAPHKFYGPKGAGVLVARRGVELMPILTGGGQENGRWAGTSNVAFAVGTAVALEMAMDELEARNAHYLPLRDHLISGLLTALPDDCVLTGHPSQRLPHNASFAFRNVNGNELLMHLDMACISGSSGSACKTGNPKPSHTLQAIGLGEEWTKGGLRLTVGMQTTMDDVEYAVEKIPSIVGKISNN